MIKYVSLYDIMNSPEGAALVRDGTEEQFLEFMSTIGFDTTKPIERQECYHRPLSSKTNEPQFGMRFVGTERNDEGWRTSGRWSLDARLEEYRQNDFELYKEMYQMSYHFNHTGALIGHMLNKGSQLPYYDQISGEELENDEQ
jgi:hypothetical protein